MSDNDPLNLHPPVETVEPRPIDANEWEASHQRALSAYNELDPNSICFGRKDMADAAKARLQSAYDVLKLKAGVVYTPPTAHSIAVAEEAQKWSFSEMSPEYWADVDQRIAVVKSQPANVRDAAVQEMVRRFGEQEYAHQSDMGRPPTMPRLTFIQVEGVRQYQEMVALAQKARPNLDPVAVQDLYLLRTLAGYGRYRQGEAKHRVKL
jgi:hypothetical protein